MKRFGLFRAGEFAFAVRLEQIQKVLQDAKKFGLPRLPEAVSDVLVDCGQIVPLLNFVHIFGKISCQERLACGYQVLVVSEYGMMALPANMSGQIVNAAKGEILTTTVAENIVGAVGKFLYQSEEFNILDINYLAIEMTQGIWHS
ncbi:MAG: chemotaxis protein CheW [Desulfuromonadales bacterium]|nr:chemotaxis protein CheW [Desulfuromonadales bacterium]